MLQSMTSQRSKAHYIAHAKRQTRAENDNMVAFGTVFYIGKVKCPKCKEDGYLKCTGSFIVQHRVKKVKINGEWRTIWRYCYLKAFRYYLMLYNRRFLQRHNTRNPNEKKRQYDQKRYYTKGRRT